MQETLSTLFQSRAKDLEVVVAPTPERPIGTLPYRSLDQLEGDRIAAYLGPQQAAPNRPRNTERMTFAGKQLFDQEYMHCGSNHSFSLFDR